MQCPGTRRTAILTELQERISWRGGAGQGSVKVRRGMKKTPHPPPCGPPSPRGRGGTARRWVRGRFVDTISIALEACYTRDFDGALGDHRSDLTDLSRGN